MGKSNQTGIPYVLSVIEALLENEPVAESELKLCQSVLRRYI